MIFCDLGVNPTPWGYSVYEEIQAKLQSTRHPRRQIAAIGDADSDAKKQALFEQVRSGAVRVLLGSTQKMGTGANVQRRLVLFIILMPRGSQPRSSSGKAASFAREMRTRRSPSSDT